MKQTVKMCIWAICAAALVCCMAGCPTEPGEGTPKLSWADGAATALTFEVGDNVGEIKYSVAHTEPVADSYTLYYIQSALGEQPDRAKIQSDGISVTVPFALSGKVSSLTEGDTYSAVLVAKKSGYQDAISGIQRDEPKASAYLTQIRIINIPVGVTGDGVNEDKEVAFVWPKVRGETRSGVGVWGGRFNKDSDIKYDDNEIIETEPGKGAVTTKLYETSQLMLFLLSANVATERVPFPSEEEVSGTGTITLQYKLNNNQTADLNGMITREWERQAYKDDPTDGYLELDWNEGVNK